MKPDKVLGLIGIPVSSTTVIEDQGNVSLVIVPDEGKIIGDVDEL
jgi:hypothetical protein